MKKGEEGKEGKSENLGDYEKDMQLARNNEKEMGARNRRRKDGELKREKEKRK